MSIRIVEEDVLLPSERIVGPIFLIRFGKKYLIDIGRVRRSGGWGRRVFCQSAWPPVAVVPAMVPGILAEPVNT
jgi:hypothetical protein